MNAKEKWVGAPGLTAGDWGGAESPLWAWECSSGAAEVPPPAEMGLRVVLMVLLLPLGDRDMAVILTTLTELTWGLGITVLMGLLVMRRVGGERRVMALVAEGLGRIWAYLCRARRSPTGLAEILWGGLGDCFIATGTYSIRGVLGGLNVEGRCRGEIGRAHV